MFSYVAEGDRALEWKYRSRFRGLFIGTNIFKRGYWEELIFCPMLIAKSKRFL